MTKEQAYSKLDDLKRLARLELKLWDTSFCGDVELTALANNRLRLYNEAELQINIGKSPDEVFEKLTRDDKFNNTTF